MSDANIIRRILPPPVLIGGGTSNASWEDRDFMTSAWTDGFERNPNYDNDFMTGWKSSSSNGQSSQYPVGAPIYTIVNPDGTISRIDASKARAMTSQSATESTQTSSTQQVSNSDYAEIISAMSKKYGVPEKIIYAIIQAESSGKSTAVSSAGAQGLMQLMPATAKAMGVTDSFDPAQNIEGGVKYLAQMHAKYGNWEHSMQAYNCGPGNMDKILAGKKNMPAETQAYVPKVYSFMNAVA